MGQTCEPSPYNVPSIPRPEPLPLFLKSIDIAGFKSFARPTRLELPPGITALVGPNGSGKSNVVDALRWAIGEQNIRDLRGQRAEDVIHAGPRRSLGLAEVTLTFDASDRSSGPAELAVARRLYRSGDSEYLVGGKKGRLRDLQDALRAIGIAGADSVVVNQGMADALLTATAQERRLVLEQAAGLAGYRVRREEARHKLQGTVQNVQTIEVILAEMEPRLRVLRRQARAVRDRDEAQERLGIALQSWYSFRWRETAARLESFRRCCEAEEAERVRLATELETLEDAAENALSVEREWRRRLDVAQAAVHATQRDLDAAGFSLRTAEQQLAALQQALTDAEVRRQELDGALQDLRAQHAESREAVETLQLEQENLTGDLTESREALAACRARLAPMEAAVERAAAEQAEAERSLSNLSSTRTRLQETLAQDRRRLEAIEARMEGMCGDRSRLEKEQSDRRAALAIAEKEAAEAGKQLRLAGTGRAEARRRLERTERVLRYLRTRAADVGRRLAAAERAVAALAGHLEATLLAELRVQPGWETAVSAALGIWPQDASSQSGSGDLNGFLSWRRGLDGRISDARWADTMVSPVPQHLTPLHGALLVDDRHAAGRLWASLSTEPAHLIGSPPLRVITRDGEVVSFLGGTAGAAIDGAARYLVARREVERGSARAARLDLWLAHAASALEERRENVRRQDRIAQEAEGELRAAEDRRSGLARDISSGERLLSGLVAEADALARERREVDARIDAGVRQDRELQDRESALAESVAAAVARLAAARRARDQEQARIQCAERDLRDREGRLDLLKAAESTERRTVAGLAQQVERLDREAQTLEANAARHRDEQERWSAALLQERARADDLTALLAAQHDALARVRADQPATAIDRGLLDVARRRLVDQVRENERALAHLGQCEEERDRLRIEILRELKCAPELLGEPGDSVPGEDEIRRLRLRANQYPDADMAVVDECCELEERYRSLRTHVEDLNDAARELDGIIAISDREMRTRFDGAFRTLNEEFGRVFRVMLRGGEATLEHSDEGGVAVRAQLPGKRARSSASFSGGEKALVASSLLFGMLRMRPAPFVVLDEVDAALDESNVDRYVAALRDISTRTQVIIVTHNRATMEAADVLYGVTMDDDGVSRLLSLRLDSFPVAG